MTIGISLRELSRRTSLDKGHLSRLAKKGLIPRHSDGSYDEQAVREALKKNLDPARRKVLPPGVDRALPSQRSTPPSKSSRVETPSPRTPAEAREAISLIARILQEEGHEAPGSVDFAAARTAETILKARMRDLQIAEKRRELVPLASVKQHVERAFIGYRQAIQRIPSRHASQIAAELQCDPARLDELLSKAIAETLAELSAPVVRA